MCLCVCVCVRGSDRERERTGEKEGLTRGKRKQESYQSCCQSPGQAVIREAVWQRLGSISPHCLSVCLSLSLSFSLPRRTQTHT